MTTPKNPPRADNQAGRTAVEAARAAKDAADAMEEAKATARDFYRIAGEPIPASLQAPVSPPAQPPRIQHAVYTPASTPTPVAQPARASRPPQNLLPEALRAPAPAASAPSVPQNTSFRAAFADIPDPAPSRPLVGRETEEGRASDTRAANASPATSTARNVRDVTNIIPGEVMGSQREFNARVREGHFSTEQLEAFAAGGSRLRDALTGNPNLRRAMGMSRQDPNGLLDINGSAMAGRPDETNYMAWAVVMEEQRTFSANKPTFEQIVATLGSDANIRRAGQILQAIEGEPLSADTNPAVHIAQAPTNGRNTPRR